MGNGKTKGQLGQFSLQLLLENAFSWLWLSIEVAE